MLNMHDEVHYDEPKGPGGTPSDNDRVVVTVREAIDRQRNMASRRNYDYATDQQALDDFLAVHWAWVVERN